MSRSLRILSPSLVSLLTLLLWAGGQVQAQEGKATLKVERQSAFSACLCRMDVYVNGEKLGNVPNGGTREFQFTPRADGRNTVYMELNLAGGKSPEMDLLCLPGGVVKASARMVVGTLATTPEFTLTTEREGVSVAPPVEVAPVVVTPAPEPTVEIDKEIVDKEVFTEPYETLPGVARTFTLERSYERSLTITGTTGVEVGGMATVGTSLLGAVSAEVKAKVEASLGVTLGKKESVTESITLDGKDVTRIKVKWVERYRKGTITLKDGTRTPFLVCVGLRLRLEKAD